MLAASATICAIIHHHLRTIRRLGDGLARQILPDVKLVETRHFDDAWQAAQQAEHGVLLLEVEARRAPQLVALLARLQAELPTVMTIACSAGAISPAWELLLREAGAALVVDSRRRLFSAAPWLRRHLALAPRPELSPRDEVWSRLPWPSASGSGSSQ